MPGWRVVAFVLGSSVLAALLSQVIPIVLARSRLSVEEEFADRRRVKDAEAERRSRIEAAHAAAATAHAEDAAKIYEDLDAIASRIAVEADVYQPEGVPDAQAARSKAIDAIQRLRAIWTRHPTRAVRDAAHELYDAMMDAYGELRPDDSMFPSITSRRDTDEALLHRTRAEALVEVLQSPPP